MADSKELSSTRAAHAGQLMDHVLTGLLILFGAGFSLVLGTLFGVGLLFVFGRLAAFYQAIVEALGWPNDLGSLRGVLIWWLCYMVAAGVFLFHKRGGDYSHATGVMQMRWVRVVITSCFALG